MTKLIDKLKKHEFTKSDLVFMGVVTALVIFVFVMLQSFASISEKKAEYDEIDRKYNEQMLMNAEMQSLLEESDEEYIERVAREKLDMVYPGERVFISSSGN